MKDPSPTMGTTLPGASNPLPEMPSIGFKIPGKEAASDHSLKLVPGVKDCKASYHSEFKHLKVLKNAPAGELFKAPHMPGSQL